MGVTSPRLPFRGPTLAHVASRANAWPERLPTRRGPDWGPLGRNGGKSRLSNPLEAEAARARLLEAAGFSLGRDLAQDGGIQRGLGRLAGGRGPVTLLGHRLDQLLAAHRLI